MKKSDENLVNLADRPPEERKKIARSGGRKSGEVRRKKREWRELVETFLVILEDIK